MEGRAEPGGAEPGGAQPDASELGASDLGGAQPGGANLGAAQPGREDPADAVFGALADGTRRRLLALLGERGEASATDLARELPVTRQAVQKHLGTLSGAGLVSARRSGREVLFRPTPAPMSEAMAWMAEVGGQWDERLAALERQIAASGRTKA
ncbi:MAG TPA: metalloregulator ArsR/SmtB family transcription factor [Thermoleophilaceae bacterium]|nr:metalloregulator ArsR/SmtB family transcription factor [Thermoleophilaceae bacterium]